MPLVTIALYEGRSTDKKREAVREVTDTVAKVLAIAPESVWVILDDVSKENWSAAGVLAIDR
jgi:4-oxalocrotonate tautomerase